MFLSLLVATVSAQLPVSHRAAIRVYQPRNVIVVVLDDVGTEQIAAYGCSAAWGESPARMPVLDQLRAHGVMFRRAWASPLCSPTRAMFLTGRHGFRTGMLGLAETPGPCAPGTTATGYLTCCPSGDPNCSLPENTAVFPLHPSGYSLPDSEITIAEMLRDSTFPGGATYARGAFGKWHLTSMPGDPCHPIRQGFDVFVGHLFNNEGAEGHYEWQQHAARATPNGCSVVSSTVTGQWDAERTAIDARAWIDGVVGENPRRSFFAMVSFNPPHWPFQVPPQSLVSPTTWDELVLAGLGTEGMRANGVLSCQPGTTQEVNSRNARLVYRASLEAVDTLIGRLVFRSSTDPFPLENTTILIIGDNGTPDQVTWSTQEPAAIFPNSAPFPANHAKRHVFELGVHVPLIVSGAGVVHGATCDALVSAVDIPATILDLVGATTAIAPQQEVDGQSFAGRFVHPNAPYSPGDRDHLYTEISSRNGMTYSTTTRQWTPVVPEGTVTYQRAILDASGYKYIRRVLGPDQGCAVAASSCGLGPEEEIYRLFDANGDLDLYESMPLCGDAEADFQRANLRSLMDAIYTGG